MSAPFAPTVAPTVALIALTSPLLTVDDIYICPQPCLAGNFLYEQRIGAIINMTGFDLDPIIGVDIVNLSLNADELLEEETARAREKIANIVGKLIVYVRECTRVALVCNTGVNKSAVILGCYLRHKGSSPCDTLTYIDGLLASTGVNLLTNQSFRKIIHERRALTPTCKCWRQTRCEYRSQVNIDY